MKGLYTGVGGKTEFQEDIRSSVLREISEETGLEVRELSLKGIVKTILQTDDKASGSWILFIYTAVSDTFNFIDCPEGDLVLADTTRLGEYDLIGFIREMMPLILKSLRVFEGTIVHDGQGRVLSSFFY